MQWMEAMDNDETLSRKAEALQCIYRNKGLNLAKDEAKALAQYLGKNPLRAAILCVVVIIALMAFLIVRFVL